jgi:hypothetical protein
MTEKEARELLIESGVDNGLGHYEDGKLQTAITSYDELAVLIDLAWQKGYEEAYNDYNH